MFFIEHKNINVGSFNEVDFHYFADHFSLTATSFNRRNDLIGTIEILNLPINPAKRINIRIVNKKSDDVAEFKNVKNHCSFNKVKNINVSEYESFILIKVMI